MKQALAHLLVTWFGSGLSRKAPGTVGSLAALPFAYAIHVYGGNAALMSAAIAAFVVGVWACDVYLTANPEASDPKEIVIDEVAGQWLVLAFLPPTWQAYAIGCVLFRLFDITKPWPVSLADSQIKGAVGVMLDDILAACYAVLACVLISVLALYNNGGSL
jgi:phosphatidylglycerophosphatase A